MGASLQLIALLITFRMHGMDNLLEELRPPLKKRLFLVKQVAKIVASRVAAKSFSFVIFFFGLENNEIFWGIFFFCNNNKKKKKKFTFGSNKLKINLYSKYWDFLTETYVRTLNTMRFK